MKQEKIKIFTLSLLVVGLVAGPALAQKSKDTLRIGFTTQFQSSMQHMTQNQKLDFCHARFTIIF